MHISEFCDKYDVTRREVDYWTRIGLLNPLVMENGYRDYSNISEDEVTTILVAKTLDYPEPIKDVVAKLNDPDSRKTMKIRERLDRVIENNKKQFKFALEFAQSKAEGRR